MRFEPAGLTDDPDLRMAHSVVDYVFRRLALDHLPAEARAALGVYSAGERTRQLETGSYGPDAEDFESLAQSAPLERAGATEAGDAVVERPARSEPGGAHRSPSASLARMAHLGDAPLCVSCGTRMRPTGSCFVCEDCGSTSGCS
jgi:ribonucleoside-diphosphate reductase alpha chain